jgi:hypothetical protein
MSLRDDINIPLVLVLGAATGLLVAVSIIGTRAAFNYVKKAEVERNYAYAEERGILHFGDNVWKPQLEALEAKDGPAWADTGKQSVAISINDAKRIYIESKGSAKAVAVGQ